MSQALDEIKQTLRDAGPKRKDRMDALLEHRTRVANSTNDMHHLAMIDTAMSVEVANSRSHNFLLGRNNPKAVLQEG